MVPLSGPGRVRGTAPTNHKDVLLVVALTTVVSLALSSPESASPSPAPPTPSSIVFSALARYRANEAFIGRRMGEDCAEDLGLRLEQDIEDFDYLSTKYGDVTPYGDHVMDDRARLDASLVDQVIDGPRPVGGVRGMAERLVTATDGTLQPFAIYVPQTVAVAPSLVILLHGRPQYDSEILADAQFQAMADKTGTIVAAPYGRAHYDYWGIAVDDVYQTEAVVASAYHVDPRKIFLVGYSNGGFAVYKVGPAHPEVWAGVMSIAGAILNSETASVLNALSKKPFYVVTGLEDDSIPTKYPQQTAQWLAGMGVRAGLYIEKTGTHTIPSLAPSLALAWSDMLAGNVTHQPIAGLSQGAPDLAPPPDMDKPTKP